MLVDACQKERLDENGNAEPTEYEVVDVSGARKCEGGEVEWLVHWAGGVERWKSDATSWQQLD